MPIPDLHGVSVLVTGGAGFIGSHLSAALAAAGAGVLVLDDLSTGRASHLAAVRPRVELVEGDVRDAATCERCCRDARYVFHLAALGSVPRSLEDPASTLAVNVQGTAALFDAARRSGVERVVYASSSSVYGDSAALPKREGEEGRPLSPYAASKRMAEELAAVFARCYGLASVGLRYFNVYGPRQDPAGPYAAVVPRFFSACLAGEAPRIHGDGEQSRDFTFVADAVAATLLAAGAAVEAGGEAYNVAGGRRVTINQLAAAVRRVAGAGAEPVHGPPRAGDVRHSLADLARARAALGYEPGTGLETGLELSRDHFAGLTARAGAV